MRYTALFCEENIWHLAADAAVVDARGATIPVASRRVLVIAARGPVCPLWNQRAGPPGAPVFWDYHVVLDAEDERGAHFIWDLDTRLPLPSPAGRWLKETFPVPLPQELRPWFRVVPAAVYRDRFSSDRTHMRDPDGRPTADFPPWPAIRQGANNLDALRQMTPSAGGASDDLGVVVDAAGLRALW